MKSWHSTSLIALAVVGVAPAAEPVAKTENKNVTIVSAESRADGKSTISREVVEECLVSLPAPDELVALSAASSEYLKDVNGKVGDSRNVKTFTATVEVNYLVRRKELIIVTTNSVTAREPVIKEVVKTVRMSETVVSDQNDGDLFAGNSPRRYYFSSAEKASANARDRAIVWLKQHKHVVCP